MLPDPRTIGALSLTAAALLFAAPAASAPAEVAAWLVRPATLPFAWQALLEASDAGDDAEVFARGQQIVRLLPGWTDGHVAFAYRYALGAATGRADEAAVAATERRLDAALAWLDGARATASPRRELELLQALALLPEVAVQQQPGLDTRLASRGGAAVMTAAWLAEAERRFPSAAVREQRTFHAPLLAAALLQNGDTSGARAVLQSAVQRSHAVRDAELAAEWRERLLEVLRWLDGDRSGSLAAVQADPRFAPLVPHLR